MHIKDHDSAFLFFSLSAIIGVLWTELIIVGNSGIPFAIIFPAKQYEIYLKSSVWARWRHIYLQLS